METLFILRHAIAEDISSNGSDASRKLTDEGISKTKKLSAIFNTLKEDIDIVLTSPYLRAKETAELFIESIRPQPKLEILECLKAGASPSDIAKGLMPFKSYKKVMIVGHNPDLEIFTGKIIKAEYIRFKKGALAKVTLFNQIEISGELEYFITSKIAKNYLTSL